jgi:hypothetical protein
MRSMETRLQASDRLWSNHDGSLGCEREIASLESGNQTSECTDRTVRVFETGIQRAEQKLSYFRL